MDPHLELQRLAKLAEELAAEDQQIQLNRANLGRIQSWLEDLGTRVSGEERSLAVAALGSWLGCLLIEELGGHWTAIDQADAPKVKLARNYCSPIDLIQRILDGDRTLSLIEAFENAAAWSLEVAEAKTPDSGDAPNNWDRYASDPRFIADSIPFDATAARALLDPWLRSVDFAGRRVLCLGGGGGRHAPIFAQLGAAVTVIDTSEELLRIDDELARKHGLEIQTECRCATQHSDIESASIDVVVQPVMTSYVRQIDQVFFEIARVSKPGGLYLSQHKTPASMQTSLTQEGGRYVWLENAIDGALLPTVTGPTPIREAGIPEYVHSNSAILGGICRSGFVIRDYDEPIVADAFAQQGSPAHRATVVPPYMKVFAERSQHRPSA